MQSPSPLISWSLLVVDIRFPFFAPRLHRTANRASHGCRSTPSTIVVVATLVTVAHALIVTVIVLAAVASLYAISSGIASVLYEKNNTTL